MAQRIFHLSEEASRALLAAYQSTDDGSYRTRLQAVRLYGLGYTPAQIAEICGCPRSTLLVWCRTYSSTGIEGLCDHRAGGNSAKLTPEQIGERSSKLRLYTPRSLLGPTTATSDGQSWTVDDLRTAVHFWFGVKYASRSSYYSLFKRSGYSYHYPTKVFTSRNEAAVLEFESQLEKK
jgi:transposase